MTYGIKLIVWGEFAAFNRPEMKVERVSYDVMTPSAARGVLEAIYWKPEMRWVVDRIHVLAPIRLTHIRRNEIASKIPVKGRRGVAQAMTTGRGQLGLEVSQDRQQRAAIVLRDVAYGIAAHVEVRVALPGEKAPEAKHLEMFKRRAATGQCFHRPYLGCREFPANFALVDEFPPCPDELKGERDFGLILDDIDFVDDPNGPIVESHRGRRVRAEPRFIAALLQDGVLDCRVGRARGA
jgi:CRISPR-associated protein Cas5d